nr:helix-turn-helix transcriptional regulator [Lachnospiraceae bacterium]
MKLCDKIQTARKRAGLSQVDLADAMGVSRQSVSKWETGVSQS